eukprot:1158763-Pelagomonas_calceolata.AAC.2
MPRGCTTWCSTSSLDKGARHPRDFHTTSRLAGTSRTRQGRKPLNHLSGPLAKDMQLPHMLATCMIHMCCPPGLTMIGTHCHSALFHYTEDHWVSP